MNVRGNLSTMRGFASLMMACALSGAAWAETKIGFVDTERIMRESAPAQRAEKKLQKEFEKKQQELERLGKQLQSMQENLEKNAVTMSESDRRAKDREFGDLNREFQRKKRDYGEEFNQRRNEELAQIIERANRTIRQLAEAEKFDLVLQEAVYRSPRIDITDKVLKALVDIK